MAGTSSRLYVELVADIRNFRRNMLEAGGTLDQFARRVTGTSVATGTALGTLGKLAGAGLVAGLAAAGREAIEFERRMLNVNTISKLSEKGLANLGDQVKNLAASGTVSQNAHELAEGLYDIASSGFQGADGMKVLTAASQAASAGMTSTAVSAKATTAVLNTYGLGAKDARDVTDILFQTVNLGVTTFEQLSHNVGDYLSQAKSLDVSFAETGSAIAAMTLQGINAAEAGTVLGSVMNQLIKPNEALGDVLARQGYASGQAAVEALGLRGTLMMLSEATGGSVTEMGALFGDTTALRGALTLTSSGGAKWAEVAGQIEDKSRRAGAASGALAEQAKGVGFQLDVLKNQAQAALIGVGEEFLPVLGEAIFGVRRSVAELGPVFDALRPVLESLWRSLGNLAEVGGDLVGALAPIAGALAAIVGVPVVAVLRGIAGALEAVTGWMADHQTVVTTLAVLYASTFVPAVAAATYRIAALAAIGIAQWAVGAVGAVASLGVAITAMGVATAAATGGLSLLVAAGAVEWQRHRQAAQDADAAIAKINATINLADPSSIVSARTAFEQMRDSAEATLTGGGVWERYKNMWNGVGDDAEVALNKANTALRAHDAAMGNAERNITTLGTALSLNRQQVVDLAAANEIDLTRSLRDVAPAMGAAAAEADAASVAAGGMTGAMKNAAQGTALTTEQAKALEQQMGKLADSLNGFTDPLTVYTDLLEAKRTKERESAEATAASTKSSTDSWQDFAQDVTVSLDEYADKLEAQIRAQEEWEDNLVTVAGRAGVDVAQQLQQMGEKGVELTAAMANGTDAEVKRMAQALRKEAAAGGAAANSELQTAYKLMESNARQGGKATVAGLAAELGVGQATVLAIAQKYGINLAEGVNPLMEALGKPPVRTGTYAGGRRVAGDRNYAQGGIEDHVAQIAPAGAWRVWAEPETGGEAYIPLSPAKRKRSLAIWEETGRRLQAFAGGGFTGESDVPRPPSVSPYTGAIGQPGAATMEKAYGDAVEWVKKNAAPQLTAGVGVAAMMKALHTRFPGLALISGLRPGSITATGNRSYHASGRAVDVPPSMAVFDWIAQHYGSKTKELIYSPAGGRQLHNGRPHVYTGVTKAMHYDHVHWAMAKGGILNPHVRDGGGPLLPGFTYNGTGRPEVVLPMASGGVVPDIVRAGTVSQGGWDRLLAAGWTGNPRDAMEALYKPIGDIVKLGQVSKEYWSRLVADGWKGNPRDNMEALYRPLSAVAKASSAAPRNTATIPASPVIVPPRPLRPGETLAGAVARAGDIAAMERVIKQWREYAQAVETAAQRTKLAADVKAAQREYDTAKGIKARTEALGELKQALAALSTWDREYRADQAVQAAEAVIEARRAQQEAEEARQQAAEEAARKQQEAVAAARRVEDNMYAVGAVSTAERLRTLDTRLAAEQRYSDEWTSLWSERKRLIEDVAQAERDAADQAARAADDLAQQARQTRDSALQAERDALATLNRLLDEEEAIRRRGAEAEATYAKTSAELAERRAERDARFAEDRAKAEQTRAEALARARQAAQEREVAAARQYEAEQQRILAARRSTLEGWARLDQQVNPAWGNGLEQLIANARNQAEQFTEWMNLLAAARARGVSEQVIGALGLDEGPQALGQLRAFNTATVEQIAALNAEVQTRTALAGEQVRREQAALLGRVGQDLAAATEAFQTAMTASQTQFAADLQATETTYRDALLSLQQAYNADVAALNEQLAQAQQTFRAAQVQMAAELAALGTEHGRSYGAALAAGLNSQVPAVVAAAQALQSATDGLRQSEAQYAAAQAAADQAAAAARAAQQQAAAAAAAAAVPYTAPAAPPAPTVPTSGYTGYDGNAFSGWGGGSAAPRPAETPPAPSSIPLKYAAYGLYGGTWQWVDVRTQPGYQAYDSGGWLEPGYTLAYNGTGKRERVLTAEQAAGVGQTSVAVRVFLGDRELTDLVRVELDSTLAGRATSATIAGSR